MTISTNTIENLITFINHADTYILKVEGNELKALKKGLWTWFSSSVLNRKEYQLSAVLNYIKQNKQALDNWDNSKYFYEIMKGKVGHSKACSDSDLKVFIEALPIVLKDTQMPLPHNILSEIFSRDGRPQLAAVSKGFYDTFYKTSTFVEIFKQVNEAKDGLLAEVVAEAKENLPFPPENDQACQAYLKFIHNKLSEYVKEFFGGISAIPLSERSTIHDNYYQEIATWIENKRLIKFFKICHKYLQGESLIASIKEKPLPEQAKAIRQFFKTCPLQEVDLSMLNLSYVPPEIGLLPNLKTLKLYHNRLKKVPQVLSQIKSLEKIDLCWNQITVAPKELGQLTNLKKLDLSRNHITEVPKEWNQLEKLEELSLFNNQIKEIPEEWKQLKSLKILDLLNNPLEKVPKFRSDLRIL